MDQTRMAATIRRLQAHLAVVTRRWPTLWASVARMRAERGRSLPLWPDWCYLPLSGAFAIATNGAVAEGPTSFNLDTGMWTGILGALIAWQPTQGVYVLDPDLDAALVRTPPGPLPREVLFRLPAWGVYVLLPTPGPWGEAGAFVHLEHDTNTGGVELRLLLDLPDPDGGVGLLVPVVILLDAPTLEEAVDALVVEANERGAAIDRGTVPSYARLMAPWVSRAAYLCTINADITPVTGSPVAPPPRRRKNRRRRPVPPPTPRVWTVGYRIGRALRAHPAPARGADPSAVGAPRATPRPHWRRAHWHLFYTGPRAGPRTPVLHWLPPIAVRLDAGASVPVIRPVRARPRPPEPPP